MFNSSNPDVLVGTQWLSDNLNNPKLRIVEFDLDSTNYQAGHIPGAVFWDRLNSIGQDDFRIQFDRSKLEATMGNLGIERDTEIVIYSSKPSGATLLFWYLKVWDHERVRILDGDYQKWQAEGREITLATPQIQPTKYQAAEPNFDSRICLIEVEKAVSDPQSVLLDVRTLPEYSGEAFWFTGRAAESGERSGHIPGAIHVSFDLALNADNTFKSVAELSKLYTSHGVTSDKEIITYCTVGARSSFSWFVLKYLLKYPRVRNYDASWNEWGRLPNVLVEAG